MSSPVDVKLGPAEEEESIAGVLLVLGGLWAIALVVFLGVAAKWIFSRKPSISHTQQRAAHRTEPRAQTSEDQPNKEAEKPGVSLKQLIEGIEEAKRKADVTPRLFGASLAGAPSSPLYINTLKGHGDVVLGLDISSNGELLVTVCQDRIVRWYDLKDVEDKSLGYRHKKLSYDPIDVAFGKSAEQFVVLSKELLETAGLTAYGPGKAPFEQQWTLEDIHQGSPGQRLLYAGKAFLAASNKTDLRVIDEQGKILARVDAAGLQTYDAALSPDGRFLAAATFTADVKVHEIKRDRVGNFQEVAKVNLNLKAHSKQVACVAFAPDSLKAITASKDGTWAVWSLQVRYHLNEDPKLLHQSHQEVPSGRCFERVAYGSDDVVAASFGNALQFLDARNGHVLETVEDAHDSGITAVRWSPVKHAVGKHRSAVLATCSRDKRVRFWRCPQR